MPRGRDEPPRLHPVLIPEPRKLRASFPGSLCSWAAQWCVPRRAAGAAHAVTHPENSGRCSSRNST